MMPPECSDANTNDRAFLPGYLVPRFTESATQREDDMQATKTKAAKTQERLSLGALMVILVITNVVVFVNLAPYA